jgi:mono/diheme cytochrome c family protein
MLRWIICLVLAVSLFGSLACDRVVEAQTTLPTLTVSDRRSARTYSVQDLLADPESAEVTIARDPVYRQSMTYRAVPVSALLKQFQMNAGDYVQVRTIDDFSVSIPAGLLVPAQTTPTEAFLAIETSGRPWPPIPGKPRPVSAGPFYIVWQTAGDVKLSSEYWAYMVASMTITDSPYKRWPGLGVADSVPASDPVRRGLDRFVAVCMACHRFNGDGEAGLGPDLGNPMNPVDYFQPAALRKYLRDPSSLRAWPDQKMPAFDEASLDDADIDAIVAWLTYKARRRP